MGPDYLNKALGWEWAKALLDTSKGEYTRNKDIN